MVDERRSDAVTSELALCECLVKPFQSGRQDFAETYLRFLQPRPGLAVVPVARSVLLQAARHRADGLTLPDAIHAATALQQTCTHFLTNDDRFRILTGIRILMLKELVSS